MNRLRELRKEQGVTQQKLADDMLVTQRTLVRYESGEREPRVAILIELADYFKVSIDYLVGRSDVR
ncbi:helix-turn-helix transcriptional regulator [Leuconostoc gasicomitatum]|uniref:helix-turn-helix domain-containing protein n=1 Tax=Leuconostoc gasicomitatum TaxID=115778 RepID=UPI000BC59F14|nr:helix-turn-helix transcriptional regulator [Leuconostoc gasicomitatum]MBZ5967247.1 helix-turn-helix transcriptional regulator [Leuconostoc gasicomitatum]QFS15377.1 transcriptional regulator [Leuconostoc gasicomitatum]SOB97732.1 Transcriptional regulator, XRE family [Leuconostoc gasicomitatum]